MSFQLQMANEKKELKRILDFLTQKHIKVKDVQTTYHEEGPVAFIYVPSSKFPFNRKGILKLSKLEKEIYQKLAPKIKVILIAS